MLKNAYFSKKFDLLLQTRLRSVDCATIADLLRPR